MIGLMQERPPLVRFDVRAVEDRNATISAGRYIARNVEMICVTPPGTKDEAEFEWSDWLGRKREDVRKGRFHPDFLKQIEAAHDAWKDGNTIPENGTPIKGWPLLSPAKQQMYVMSNIRTVEDLAALTEEGMRNAGMGARGDKMLAQEWLAKADSGKAAAEITALRLKLEDTEERNRQLQGALDALSARLDAMETKQPRQQRRQREDQDALA